MAQNLAFFITGNQELDWLHVTLGDSQTKKERRTNLYFCISVYNGKGSVVTNGLVPPKQEHRTIMNRKGNATFLYY